MPFLGRQQPGCVVNCKVKKNWEKRGSWLMKGIVSDWKLQGEGERGGLWSNMLFFLSFFLRAFLSTLFLLYNLIYYSFLIQHWNSWTPCSSQLNSDLILVEVTCPVAALLHFPFRTSKQTLIATLGKWENFHTQDVNNNVFLFSAKQSATVSLSLENMMKLKMLLL